MQQQRYNTIKKFVKDLYRYFSKKEIVMANRQEKLLRVTNHQRNANYNHNVI